MNKLEHDLKAQPRQALPPEGREEILANAAGDDSTINHGTMSWLLPKWLRCGVAAAWAISLTLHLRTPAVDKEKSLASTTITNKSDHPMKWLLAIQTYHDDKSIY